MSKYVKKITKPISKVLDKIVPNEIKPLLPYAAAFAPYLLPAAGIASLPFAANPMLQRALLSGAANLGSQVAQEGSGGDFNPLSVLLAGGQGALTTKGAGDFFRGKMNPGEAVGMPRGNVPGLSGGFKYDTSGLGAIDKGKNFLFRSGAKLSDLAGGARETIQNPFDSTFKDLAKAASPATTLATGDLAYADANRAMKQFNRDEAIKIAEDAARAAGADQEMIDAVTSSMGAYGYDQTEIDNILSQYFANGGRVGYAFGGGIMETPEADFISMDEVVENVDGDKIEDSFEGATAEGYKLNDFEFQQDVFDTFGLKLYNLKDDPEAGTFDEGQVREMLYSDQYASGGVINAYNMGGTVLPQGMEMDYRQGGMIPMGSKERADDVPARVSKNEFVMTADAVRAAGGGSVNKGAQKLYQLMNNLEART